MPRKGMYDNSVKLLLALSIYFPTAYYPVYGVNSNTSLNRNDYLYLKVADLVIYLA